MSPDRHISTVESTTVVLAPCWLNVTVALVALHAPKITCICVEIYIETQGVSLELPLLELLDYLS